MSAQKGRMTLLELTNLLKKVRPYWIILLLGALLLVLLIVLFSLLLQKEQVPVVESPEPSPAPLVQVVTAEQIAGLSYHDTVLGDLKWELSEESLAELNRVLLEYDICAPEEISHFLAQVTVETAAGQALTEHGDEAYFQSRGYTTGTRGAGYLHLTFEYGQMAFSLWMMKKYVPELEGISYKNPASHGSEEIAQAYYRALQTAANLGLDVSLYSRIVFDEHSPVTTGADYIAQNFAWESAGYYWHIAGIGEALSANPGVENVDIASERVGGSNWQSRREAYMAFYPVLANELYGKE